MIILKLVEGKNLNHTFFFSFIIGLLKTKSMSRAFGDPIIQFIVEISKSGSVEIKHKVSKIKETQGSKAEVIDSPPNVPDSYIPDHCFRQDLTMWSSHANGL